MLVFAQLSQAVVGRLQNMMLLTITPQLTRATWVTFCLLNLLYSLETSTDLFYPNLWPLNVQIHLTNEDNQLVTEAFLAHDYMPSNRRMRANVLPALPCPPSGWTRKFPWTSP